MATAVGIDLGTTNSVIASWQGGEPVVIGFADDVVADLTEHLHDVEADDRLVLGDDDPADRTLIGGGGAV